MLLGNYSVIHKSPGKFLGGVGAICGNNWGKNGQRMAIYTEASIPDQWGLPVGYSSGWMLPRKSGYVVAFTEMSLSGTGNAVMGVNGVGESSITLSANAELSLVVSSTGICEILLTLTGDSVGALYANGVSEIELTGIGTLGAVAFTTGESSVTLSASADISALGFITGTMSPFTELSPEGLASAVWNSLASEYNTSGSMGAKLNTASSGGVDMNALAQAVWEYGMRSLTESAGLSTEEHDKLFSLENGTGHGGIGVSTIQNSINSAKRDIIKKIEEIPTTDLTEISNKLNTIDIAKEEIIDTIKSSSESLENEITSDIIRKTNELREDNVSTRNLIRQKTKKLDENLSKLSDRQELIDKTIEDEAEDLEEEIERILEEEADMVEQQIDEQLKKEADDIEQEINSNQETNGNS